MTRMNTRGGMVFDVEIVVVEARSQRGLDSKQDEEVDPAYLPQSRTPPPRVSP